MPSTETLLTRVRKLLALATSSNVHEAASAAAAAQALIERHRLDALLVAEDEGQDGITDAREAPLERAKRLRRWKVALASGLADVNGCIAYTMEVGDETHLLVLGRRDDREAVAALWGWLAPRIEWLSATHGAGKPKRWHEAFRVGAADVVVASLAQAGDALAAEVPSSALVIVEPRRAARAAAVDAFAERHLRMGKGRRLWLDARAHEQGRRIAAGLSWTPPREG